MFLFKIIIKNCDSLYFLLNISFLFLLLFPFLCNRTDGKVDI